MTLENIGSIWPISGHIKCKYCKGLFQTRRKNIRCPYCKMPLTNPRRYSMNKIIRKS